jgi:hypothetical protein
MDLRRYPGAMRFSSNGYFFFCLAAAFLAMLPSVAPKSWFTASRQSKCMNLDYATIAKLILCASKKVNDRHAIAICDRARPSRDAWTQRALPDQDGNKFSCGRTKSRRPRSRTISWLFGRMVDQSEAWQQQKRILYRLPLAASFQQIIR